MKSFLTLLSLVIISLSCKKDNNNSSSNNPNPNPVSPTDTLTAGWTKHSPGFTDIFFVDSQVGYGLSDNSITKTTDGGITWNTIKALSSAFFNVNCSPDGKAFFIGDVGKLYSTSNAGVSIDSFSFNENVMDIFFPDNNNGYVIGRNHFFKTLNGGINWTAVTPLNGISLNNSLYYGSLFFTDATTGWIILGSNIYYNDGTINNWTAATLSPAPASTFDGIYASSPNTIYASTQDGEVYKSTNGGLNFSRVADFPETDFSDIHFVDDNTGYVSIGHKLYKTTDGGNNWQTVATLVNEKFIEVYFTDATHGWAGALSSNGTSTGALLIYNP